MTKKNNSMQIFNNELFGKVRTTEIEGKIYFAGKDIAEALGYSNASKAIKDHCKGVTKRYIVDITGLEQKMNVIPESDLYRLIIRSKLPQAEEFERWIVEEVLPAIRTQGAYITEEATNEEIDLAAKYSLTRIKNTFLTCSIETLKEDFEILNNYYKKASNNSTDNRLKAYKLVRASLEERHASYVSDGNLGLSYVIKSFLDDILRPVEYSTKNRSNGGIKASKTKKISLLEDELDKVQEKAQEYKAKVNFYEPTEEEWIRIDCHPFSENSMYKSIQTASGKIKKVRSDAYNNWINKFPNEQVPTFDNIDWSKPVFFILRYDVLEKFDKSSFRKSTIDQLSRALGVDDKEFIVINESINNIVDTYNDGTIWVAIRQ